MTDHTVFTLRAIYNFKSDVWYETSLALDNLNLTPTQKKDPLAAVTNSSALSSAIFGFFTKKECKKTPTGALIVPLSDVLSVELIKNGGLLMHGRHVARLTLDAKGLEKMTFEIPETKDLEIIKSRFPEIFGTRFNNRDFGDTIRN